MPVDEDIDLSKPLTDDDISKLNSDAEKAENAVERIEKAESKAEKKTAKIDKLERQSARSLLDIENSEQAAFDRTPLGRQGGNSDFESGGFGGMAPISGQLASRRPSRRALDKGPMGEMRRSIEETRIKQEELLDKYNNLEQKLSGGLGNMFAMGASTDPFGFLRSGTFSRIARLSGYLFIAVTVATAVTHHILKQFKPGGTLDIRKLMQDRDKEMIELNDIIDRRAGRVFFTSETGLRQGEIGRQTNNTERLVEQSLRYQALHPNE